jgi:hypothetical protein
MVFNGSLTEVPVKKIRAYRLSTVRYIGDLPDFLSQLLMDRSLFSSSLRRTQRSSIILMSKKRRNKVPLRDLCRWTKQSELGKWKFLAQDDVLQYF